MAVERAIFGPANVDLIEVLTDGETACLVPPDDLETAHQRLRELVEDAALRRAWPRRREARLADLGGAGKGDPRLPDRRLSSGEQAR